ncbi:hypothetical protein GEMRC1_006105 [Eukaryota sp. GEM-RC1]
MSFAESDTYSPSNIKYHNAKIDTHFKLETSRFPDNQDGVLKVTAQSFPNHLAQSIFRLFVNPQRDSVQLTAVSSAIQNLVSAVELFKQQSDTPFYQLNELGSFDAGSDYIPAVEGHDRIHVPKPLAFMSITLSRKKPEGEIQEPSDHQERNPIRSADFFMDRQHDRSFRGGRRSFRPRGGFRSRGGLGHVEDSGGEVNAFNAVEDLVEEGVLMVKGDPDAVLVLVVIEVPNVVSSSERGSRRGFGGRGRGRRPQRGSRPFPTPEF